MKGGTFLEIIETGDGILLKNAEDFEPMHVFECGQCFRWHRQDDGSYRGVAMGRLLTVRKDSSSIMLQGATVQEFNSTWRKYFDLDRDYGQIKSRLAEDEVLKRAVEFGYGIRILNQDIWETLVSFIISANNRIPRIMRTVESLCACYGERRKASGAEYYSFPGPGTIASLSEDEVRSCGCGFRAPYIIDAARRVSGGEVDLDGIREMDTVHARKSLMELRGVGPKVADCVLLFSMHKYDAFPVDVWVKRVMEHFYIKEDAGLGRIQEYASEKFGNLAGFAQQYLFYYIRELFGRELSGSR